MKKTIILIIVALVIVIGVLGYFLWPKNNGADESAESGQACQEADGQWLAEYQECEYGNPDWCQEANGEFFECESSCRHNLEPTAVCTMQCVPVCKFGLSPQALGQSPENATYYLEDQAITLKDGQTIMANQADETKPLKIAVFNQPVVGDLNGDGLEDSTLILTQSVDEAIFYYLTVALQTDSGYQGTNVILLGNQIATQTTTVEKGVIITNYADRYPWEEPPVKPTVAKSRYLIIEDSQLIEETKEALTPNQARQLAVETWGDCQKQNCEQFSIGILDGQGGVWYVEATYSGLADDSVSAEKKVAQAHYVNNEWTLGEDLYQTYQCQPGRGSQEFSQELCL